MAKPERAHERSDVNVKAVAIFFAGFTAVAVVLHVALWWLLWAFNHGGPFELRFPGLGEVAPEVGPSFWPGELSTAGADVRARQEASLKGYHWVDRGAGVVAIPIDRAMDLVVQRGLQPGSAAEVRP